MNERNERIEKLLEQVQVNKQIQRLAEQAGCTIDRLGYGEGNIEKFAELIVRECLHIVDDEGAGEGGCIRAMIRIQEEFGVEDNAETSQSEPKRDLMKGLWKV